MCITASTIIYCIVRKNIKTRPDNISLTKRDILYRIHLETEDYFELGWSRAFKARSIDVQNTFILDVHMTFLRSPNGDVLKTFFLDVFWTSCLNVIIQTYAFLFGTAFSPFKCRRSCSKYQYKFYFPFFPSMNHIQWLWYIYIFSQFSSFLEKLISSHKTYDTWNPTTTAHANYKSFDTEYR